MDNFDLKKYLAEGRLFKEEINEVDIASELTQYFNDNPINNENQNAYHIGARKHIEGKFDRPLTPQEKGKITRMVDQYRRDFWGRRYREESEKEDKKQRERYQNNLLPLTVDNGSGKPDPTYYELANTYYSTDRDGNVSVSHSDPKSGYTSYRLKDKWIDTPVDNSVLNKFWKDNTMMYFGIERK
jgi:hypothetical protein